jgi:hypothetical protein
MRAAPTPEGWSWGNRSQAIVISHLATTHALGRAAPGTSCLFNPRRHIDPGRQARCGRQVSARPTREPFSPCQSDLQRRRQRSRPKRRWSRHGKRSMLHRKQRGKRRKPTSRPRRRKLLPGVRLSLSSHARFGRLLSPPPGRRPSRRPPRRQERPCPDAAAAATSVRRRQQRRLQPRNRPGQGPQPRGNPGSLARVLSVVPESPVPQGGDDSR